MEDIEIETHQTRTIGQTRQIMYVSELLKSKFSGCYNRLMRILDKHNVEHSLIKGTKDIWCRDYMPIQTESGKLIQFRYNPSYLKGEKEWEASRTDVKEVCRLNHLDVTYSDINIDGGNVLICDGRAILTDRIFSENANWNKKELVSELSNLLECEIIIIPAINTDCTGHADGMVRFVNRNTILGNCRGDDYKYIRDGINKACRDYGLGYIDIPFFEQKYDKSHELNAIGIYVNYLEVNNLIIIPAFNVEGNRDEEAEGLIKRIFPERIIETIDYNDVAIEGGLLNCTTWTIKQNN